VEFSIDLFLKKIISKILKNLKTEDRKKKFIELYIVFYEEI
jgi:hypothetical protein